jgi:hypothetical protein
MALVSGVMAHPWRTLLRSRWARLGVAAAMVATFVAVLAPSSNAAGDPVIAAAGDIACDPTVSWFNNGQGTATDCRQMGTAGLLTGVDAVLPLGDNQYNCGGGTAFAGSYDPSWGQFKAISHPVPGNHEYWTTSGSDCSTQPDAAPYFRYFGAAAGDPTKGYYSYDLGSWHIIAMNSECGYVASIGSCGLGSPEETWLRNDLAAHSSAPCTMAYWHRPRFASTASGGDTSYSQFWTDLYAAHADVILTGHAHWYERFALQHPSGQLDPNGIREFVVGTGGEESGSAPSTRLANNEALGSGVFGVLKMTLHPGSYDWNFVRDAKSTSTFTDSGSTACHNAAAPSDTTAPTTTISCDGAPCTDTVYSNAVSVALSATDTGGSGLSATRYTTDGTDPVSSATAVAYQSPFSVSQTTTVRFASVDAAGNQESPQTRVISVSAPVDSTAPTTTISCNSLPCSTNTYSAPVSVALSATDSGGSGVSETRYTTDGTDPTSSTSAVTYSAPFSVTGTTTVRFASIDVAGNQEAPQSQQISVSPPADTTAPVTTISCNGSTCVSGWYRTSGVSVALSATDTGGSGVSATRYTTDGTDPRSSTSALVYSSPFTVSTTTTVRFSSMDAARNEESPKSQLIRIDAAAPSVAITAPPDGSSAKRGTTIVIQATATDAGTGSAPASGMANVTFYRDGIKIGTDSSSPYSVNWSTSGRSFGAHSLTAVAKDVAGNTATSAPITVTLTR